MNSRVWCILGWSLACSPRQETSVSRDLPSLFPDATRLFGNFAIQLEKSRDTNTLSQAKIMVEQGPLLRVTLLLKLMHTQERVTLSFLHQTPTGPIQEDASHDLPVGLRAPRCMPSTEYVADGVVVKAEATIDHDNSELLKQGDVSRFPLPLGIKDAQEIEVLGADGIAIPTELWAIDEGSLILGSGVDHTDQIQIQWNRIAIPETRYPLVSDQEPMSLTAVRLDQDQEVPLSVSWRQGFIYLAPQLIKADSWIRLSYEIPKPKSGLLILPQEPLLDDLRLQILQPECQIKDFLLEKSTITWKCAAAEGPLFSASYPFRQQTGGMDFSDWPELARLPPSEEFASWDDGQPLPVLTLGPQRLWQKVPKEASRVCLRMLWTPE